MDNEAGRILRLLIENQDKRYSIRKIALERKINYKSAYNAAHKLKEEGSASLENLGNTTICSFTKKLNPMVYAVEDERAREATKDRDLKTIQSRLRSLPIPYIALLFGSYAKKQKTRASDIDLMIVTDQKTEAERCISLIPLDIHLSLYSYREFSGMLQSKEYNVAAEAVKKNIILAGIEDYYRVLENAEARQG